VVAGQGGEGGACVVDGPREEVAACGPLPLAEYCGTYDCPSSPTDFDLNPETACGLNLQLERYDSDCGGVVARYFYALSERHYSVSGAPTPFFRTRS